LRLLSYKLFRRGMERQPRHWVGVLASAVNWYGVGQVASSFWRVSDFKKLLVWHKAHALALHTHRVATRIRRSHEVALRAQLVRAAMSMPANIVEGRRQDRNSHDSCESPLTPAASWSTT